MSNQYRFTISLLLNDLYGAISITKENFPKSGKLLEFMYVSRGFPDIDDFKMDSNSELAKVIDCAANSIYSNSIKCRKSLISDCRQVANLFHLGDSEFEYYYFIACVCYVLEKKYNDRIDTTIFDDKQLSLLIGCTTKLENMLNGLVNFNK